MAAIVREYSCSWLLARKFFTQKWSENCYIFLIANVFTNQYCTYAYKWRPLFVLNVYRRMRETTTLAWSIGCSWRRTQSKLHSTLSKSRLLHSLPIQVELHARTHVGYNTILDGYNTITLYSIDFVLVLLSCIRYASWLWVTSNSWCGNTWLY